MDKCQHSSSQPPEDDKISKRRFLLQVARYSQLAFILPAATLLGWIVGLALDRWLHTGWIYIAGIILGSIAGFVELIRTTMFSDSR